MTKICFRKDGITVFIGERVLELTRKRIVWCKQWGLPKLKVRRILGFPIFTEAE